MTDSDEPGVSAFDEMRKILDRITSGAKPEPGRLACGHGATEKAARTGHCDPCRAIFATAYREVSTAWRESRP